MFYYTSIVLLIVVTNINTSLLEPSVVRVERIELSVQPWEGHVLPLHHTRKNKHFSAKLFEIKLQSKLLNAELVLDSRELSELSFEFAYVEVGDYEIAECKSRSFGLAA